MNRLWISALLMTVPLFAGWFTTESNDASPAAELSGTWSTIDERESGPIERVWHFGPKAKGHFRVERGNVAETKTFRYEADGAQLRLTFDKGLESHRIDYTLGDRELNLLADPDDGANRTYRALRDPRTNPNIYATYGAWPEDGPDFAMYQMLAPNLQGRGWGWFHRGDSSEWTTERFQYRAFRYRMLLMFPHRGDESLVDLRAPDNYVLYRLVDDSADACAFTYTRAAFSQWLDGVPLPYGKPAQADSAAQRQRHEERCRATLVSHAEPPAPVRPAAPVWAAP